MMIDKAIKLAAVFVSVNTYLSACLNQAPRIPCVMHKEGIQHTGVNCYFAMAVWFVSAGYILGRE
jgi:hypothetical protein